MNSLIKDHYITDLKENENVKKTTEQLDQTEKLTSDLTQMFCNAIGAMDIIRTQEAPYMPFEEGQFFGNLYNIKSREKYCGDIMQYCQNNFDLYDALEKIYLITKDYTEVSSDTPQPGASADDLIDAGSVIYDSLIERTEQAQQTINQLFGDGELSKAIELIIQHEMEATNDFNKDFAFNLFNTIKFDEKTSVYDHYKSLFDEKYADAYKTKKQEYENRQISLESGNGHILL